MQRPIPSTQKNWSTDMWPKMFSCPITSTWWRHQMETFSALLALCAGNSPVPVNSTHKGQWRGALMFSLIYAWINDWVNNREAGDLRRHHGHCDVNVMNSLEINYFTCSTFVWLFWYHRPQNAFKSNKIIQHTQKTVFNAYISSIFLHGSDIWTLTQPRRKRST